MKIEKVTYQKTYSIGPYLTDRIGLEASIEEDESAADVLDNLRAAADEWHKGEHPHLYKEELYPYPDPRFHYATSGQLPIVEVQYSNGHTDALEGIKNSKDMEELASYKKLANTNEELYKVYMSKIKELSQ